MYIIFCLRLQNSTCLFLLRRYIVTLLRYVTIELKELLTYLTVISVSVDE